MTALDVIGFDGDDTLWHDISTFMSAKQAFLQLLAKYCPPEQIDSELDKMEMQNLQYFGYGAKGFIISMIETAIHMTRGQIQADEIQEIVDFGKQILSAPVTPLDGVETTISSLAERYRLMIITKGDLFDQEAKIARSGLGQYFDNVEILSEKTVASYSRLFARQSIDPGRFLMVGNSLKSDVLPVIGAGGRAVHVPYHTTWFMELPAESDHGETGYFEIKALADVQGVIEQIENSTTA
jgi:putative hydrolase of the HAD superfamily